MPQCIRTCGLDLLSQPPPCGFFWHLGAGAATALPSHAAGTVTLPPVCEYKEAFLLTGREIFAFAGKRRNVWRQTTL